jgi:hypothetical protein
VFATDRPLSYAAFVRDPASDGSGHPVDEEGRFRVPAAPGSIAFLIVSGARAYAPSSVAVLVDEHDDPDRAAREPLVLRTEVGAAVGGLAPDVPPGTELRLVAESYGLDDRARTSGDVFDARARVDPDGRFVFPAAPIGPGFRLYAFPRDADGSGEARESGAARHLAATVTRVAALDACGESSVRLELARGVRLSGRVEGPDGRPLPGARVAVILPGGWSSLAPLVACTATSAPDGRFELERVPAGSVLVTASHEGFLESPKRLVDPTASANGPDGLVLRLGAARSLTGRVQLEDGTAVSGARVRATLDPRGARDLHSVSRGAGSSATSGADGAFVIEGLGSGPFRLRAEAVGVGTPLVAELCGASAGAAPHTLVLREPMNLSGRVVTDEGAPVRRFDLFAARVVPGTELYAEELRCAFDGSDGRFRLPDLVPGTWRLGARASERLTTSLLQIGPDGSGSELVLELHPAGSVQGRVVRPDGTPVPRAEVVVSGVATPWLEPVQADADGRFEVRGLPQGSMTLAAAEERVRAPGPRALVEVVAAGVHTDVELVLPLGGRIAGRVLGLDGDGRGGLYAQLVEARTRAAEVTITDASGWFVEEGLRPGLWSVSVAFVGSRTVTEEVAGNSTTIFADEARLRTEMRTVLVEAGKTTEVLFLERDETEILVRGVVRDGARPHAKAWVMFVPPDVGEPADTVNVLTDENGAFEVGVPRAGSWTIRVDQFPSDANDDRRVHFVRTISAATTELDLAFPQGLVEGSVLDGDGVPLPGVRVRLEHEGRSTASEYTADRISETITDADGRYVLPHLRSGRYTLVTGGRCADCPAGAVRPPRIVEGSFELAEGEHVSGLDVRAGRDAGAVEVLVRDEAGLPVAGATLFVRDDAGRHLDQLAPVITGMDGVTTYPWLEPGNYSVFARREGRTSRESGLHVVAPGAVVRTELVLERGTLLWIALVDADGAPSNGWVEVRDDRGRRVDDVFALQDYHPLFLRGAASPNGTVAGPLPPGEYTVRAFGAAGNESAPVTVTLTAEPERHLVVGL